MLGNVHLGRQTIERRSPTDPPALNVAEVNQQTNVLPLCGRAAPPGDGARPKPDALSAGKRNLVRLKVGKRPGKVGSTLSRGPAGSGLR